MKFDREIVPFKLAVPFGKHRAFRTAETGTDTFRLCNRERFCLRIIRPPCKAAVPGKKLIQNKLRRAARRGKRHHRDIGKVVADMLTVNAHNTV